MQKWCLKNTVWQAFLNAIIEEVYNKSSSKLKTLLEHREDLWILKLRILSLQGHISLNYPQDTAGSIW